MRLYKIIIKIMGKVCCDKYWGLVRHRWHHKIILETLASIISIIHMQLIFSYIHPPQQWDIQLILASIDIDRINTIFTETDKFTDQPTRIYWEKWLNDSTTTSSLWIGLAIEVSFTPCRSKRAVGCDLNRWKLAVSSIVTTRAASNWKTRGQWWWWFIIDLSMHVAVNPIGWILKYGHKQESIYSMPSVVQWTI